MQPRITGEISIWACLWDYLDFVLTDVRKPILIVSWTVPSAGSHHGPYEVETGS